MKHIYVISGLTANEKAFKKLDFGSYKVHYIQWLIPTKNETLTNYSKRMASSINTSHDVNLLGLSFGGIIVQEIAKQIDVKKLIIVSSVKKRSELPLLYKASFILKLHNLLPISLIKDSKTFARILFGTKNIKIIKLIDEILTIRNEYYLKWSINNVVNWRRNTSQSNILHIHGNKDKVFPFKNINNAIEIKNGSHLMILTKAKEIEKHIITYLNS
ncbi:MAG: alpha/beta hydrolase [Ichthyobacteriaceae bacterium]|nr:alpha/beta hydrolase [Ichthyobacteriaceae bacterium]